MARRPHYGAERRQKELKRQQKQADKEERKRIRKEAAAADADGGLDAAETRDGEFDSVAAPVIPAAEAPGGASA